MEKLYQEIKNTVVAAGKIILQAKDLHLQVKSGNQNFVTQYDVEVENYLINHLLQLLPQADILAEESSLTSNLTSDYVFIIDPIDGTTNFIHHINHSAISVALAYKKELLFGIIHNPYVDETFYAGKNQGVFLNNYPITVSKRSLDRKSVV